MTANSTCCEANLFSDDLKSMEMKRTPVLAIAFFRGSRERKGIPTSNNMTPNNPDTGSDRALTGAFGGCDFGAIRRETVGNAEIHTNVRGGTSGQPCHQNAFV
jgi:hypothetical protein